MAIEACVAPNVGKAVCSTMCIFAANTVSKCLLHCLSPADRAKLVVPGTGKPSVAQLAMALEEVFTHGADTMKEFGRSYDDGKK